MHALNSSVSNPAVDGLHCGQIALRERESNFRIQMAEQSAACQTESNEQQQIQQSAPGQEVPAQQQEMQAAQQGAQTHLEYIRAEHECRDVEAGARFICIGKDNNKEVLKKLKDQLRKDINKNVSCQR